MITMNIYKELLKEHSLQQAKKIATYATLSAENFAELMECYLTSEYRVSQRAAWSLSHAAQQKPALIAPYLETLVKQLYRKDVHNSVIRNSLRILQYMEVPDALHGDLMNACFDFIQSPVAPAAFKAFSLTILQKLCKHYPEIRLELQLIIKDRWEIESPALIARAKKNTLKFYSIEQQKNNL